MPPVKLLGHGLGGVRVHVVDGACKGLEIGGVTRMVPYHATVAALLRNAGLQVDGDGRDLRYATRGKVFDQER